MGYLPGFQVNSVPHVANGLIMPVVCCWPACRRRALSAFPHALLLCCVATVCCLSKLHGRSFLCCLGMLSMYLAVDVHFMLNKTSWWYDCANWLYLLHDIGNVIPDMDGDSRGGPGICCAWRALCHLRRIPDCPGRGLHQCIRFSPYLSPTCSARASAAPARRSPVSMGSELCRP